MDREHENKWAGVGPTKDLSPCWAFRVSRNLRTNFSQPSPKAWKSLCAAQHFAVMVFDLVTFSNSGPVLRAVGRPTEIPVLLCILLSGPYSSTCVSIILFHFTFWTEASFYLSRAWCPNLGALDILDQIILGRGVLCIAGCSAASLVCSS